MHISMHTHRPDKPRMEVEFSHNTGWNPWLTIKHYAKNITPEEVVMHLDGLSEEEGIEFAKSWRVAGSRIDEWAENRGKDEEGVKP